MVELNEFLRLDRCLRHFETNAFDICILAHHSYSLDNTNIQDMYHFLKHLYH